MRAFLVASQMILKPKPVQPRSLKTQGKRSPTSPTPKPVQVSENEYLLRLQEDINGVAFELTSLRFEDDATYITMSIINRGGETVTFSPLTGTTLKQSGLVYLPKIVPSSSQSSAQQSTNEPQEREPFTGALTLEGFDFIDGWLKFEALEQTGSLSVSFKDFENQSTLEDWGYDFAIALDEIEQDAEI